MFYLADLKNKQVTESGTALGSDPTVLFDNISRKCLLKVNERALWVGKISVGNVVKLSDVRPAQEEYSDGMLTAEPLAQIFAGQKIYDTNGKLLGELENAEFTSTLSLRKFWIDKREFTRREIAAVGDALLIKTPSPKQQILQQAKALKFPKSTKTATLPTTATKLPNAPLPTAAPTTPQKTAAVQETTATDTSQAPLDTPTLPVAVPQEMPRTAVPHNGTIRKKYGNFNFLVGKTVDKTIVNFQGEVMIKKSETVTKETLRQAKISGKLIELYLHVD